MEYLFQTPDAGEAVTVEGLNPEVLLAGSTVTVKQGAKIVSSVTGAFQAASFAVGGGVQHDNTRDSGWGGFYVNTSGIPISFGNKRGDTTSIICRVRAGQTLKWYNTSAVLYLTVDGVLREGTGSYVFPVNKDVAITITARGDIGPNTAHAIIA